MNASNNYYEDQSDIPPHLRDRDDDDSYKMTPYEYAMTLFGLLGLVILASIITFGIITYLGIVVGGALRCSNWILQVVGL